MKKLIIAAAALAIALPMVSQASPQSDLKKFQSYYNKKFPGLKLSDYADGSYALNKTARSSWEAIMEFPPYEAELEKAEKAWNTPFKNGKTYASCFKNGGKGIAQNYPYWDAKKKMVKTIELEINECRKKNGEEPYKYKKGPLVLISAHLHVMAAGKKTNVTVPNDKAALKAYNDGKKFFFTKRGQLNFSCANCHYDSVGMGIQTANQTLSPAVGHTTHFTSYRHKWGKIGTIQRRYTGCNKNIRAKPQKAQSERYRNLQYFHTYLSNGIALNAPGVRP